MFDGTDLSMAYGSVYESQQYQPQVPSQQQPQQPQGGELPFPQSTSSHEAPPNPTYNPPADMYAQQRADAKPAAYVPYDTFWDRLARKKWEVLKFIVLSLVIVLGISIDRVSTHYINAYIGKSFLTETQELIVRLSYPVAVILLLWVIKANA